MKTALPFDFEIDKKNLITTVRKEFNAGLTLVWDAFTKPEILDQWWAPKPYLSKTKHMSFREGGRRLYAMVSPEGQEHWAIQDYTSITPTTNFKYIDAFADKDGNANPDDPGSEWNLTFSETKEPDGNPVTTVNISIQSKTLADLEMTIQMGFKEGFTMTLNYLAELVQTLKSK